MASADQFNGIEQRDRKGQRGIHFHAITIGLILPSISMPVSLAAYPFPSKIIQGEFLLTKLISPVSLIHSIMKEKKR
jgi:hypothetical protein